MRKNKIIIPLLIIILISSCRIFVSMINPNQPESTSFDTQEISPSPTISFTLSPSPSPMPTVIVEKENNNTPDLLACERPYQSQSIWNQPIDWNQAKIHSDSPAMIRAFLASRNYVGANVNSYAPNIYFVTNKTPLVSLKLEKNRFRDAIDGIQIIYGDPGGEVMMPIPIGAIPSPGSDGQLVIINTDTGEEWGLREGSIDSNGQWSATGAYRYHIGNSGLPPTGFGMRGAGIGQLAGIIRPCEVFRGEINHAVTLAYDSPCAPETCAANARPDYIPPFVTTDGRGKDPFDIPEGARIVIRPEISLTRIKSVCQGFQGCVVWVVNMQQYGGFIVDRSGGAKTYAEGDQSAQWDPNVWDERMLEAIPHTWYAVLDWDFNSTFMANDP